MRLVFVSLRARLLAAGNSLWGFVQGWSLLFVRVISDVVVLAAMPVFVFYNGELHSLVINPKGDNGETCVNSQHVNLCGAKPIPRRGRL